MINEILEISKIQKKQILNTFLIFKNREIHIQSPSLIKIKDLKERQNISQNYVKYLTKINL